MLRTMLLASTLALGLTGIAFAQGGPRLVGGGPDAEVVYDAPPANVVGGGFARITGEADNRTIAYGSTPQAQASSGLVAEITGDANSRHVTYRNAAPAPTGLARVHSSQSGS
ncbi:hypothetical protein [Paracraurococcus lichenis]|uniref:Uncharacterized protein n=1 Tax=Paracraurococcus lichenis TaxID=3064888 RepID=A0ABT9E2S8_9PROT|nr:hypothetical protein [Paracraurococcus sp. LOR1-02]MDO9710464.1 hypothetical protein [Paracraurococcus sp. LOR1-02]